MFRAMAAIARSCSAMGLSSITSTGSCTK
jgi:hypothetical protein